MNGKYGHRLSILPEGFEVVNTFECLGFAVDFRLKHRPIHKDRYYIKPTNQTGNINMLANTCLANKLLWTLLRNNCATVTLYFECKTMEKIHQRRLKSVFEKYFRNENAKPVLSRRQLRQDKFSAWQPGATHFLRQRWRGIRRGAPLANHLAKSRVGWVPHVTPVRRRRRLFLPQGGNGGISLRDQTRG